MNLDALLKMSAAQDVTVSAASTSSIDTKAAGDSYEGAFAYFKCDTTAGSGSSASTVNFLIQTSATSSFASTTTLFDSGAIEEASITAGGIEKSGRLAQGALRYLRAYYTVGSQPLTAGAFSAYIVKDVATVIE